MSRPVRSIDASGVEKLAAYAGLNLDEDRLEIHADLIRGFFDTFREWDDEKLGYSFDAEAGTFEHVPTVTLYRIPTEYPTALAKNRVPSSPDDR